MKLIHCKKAPDHARPRTTLTCYQKTGIYVHLLQKEEKGKHWDLEGACWLGIIHKFVHLHTEMKQI
jgi:hypothetical protein